MQLLEENMINLFYKKDFDRYIYPWGIETFYFDNSKSWMIYVSHEGTITFTGDKLVAAAAENIHGKYIYR